MLQRKFKSLRLKANNGKLNTEECYELGVMYRDGQGVGENLDEAFKWIKKAALQDDPYAEYVLALMYRDGEGTPKNLKKAFEWMGKAVDEADSDAEYLADAQYALGVMYRDGKGVELNLEEAQYFFQLAVKNGCKEAKAALNKIKTSIVSKNRVITIPNKLKGSGISLVSSNSIFSKNLNNYNSKEELTKNVDKVLPSSQVISNSIKQKTNVPPSIIKNISKENTSAIQKGLYLYRVERNFNEAFPYVLEGANQGDLDCQFTLGRMYSEGRGVEKNLKLAIEWYEKAAHRKEPDAQFNLALIYEHGGVGIEVDEVEALRWCQEAADNGAQNAQAKLRELSAKINSQKEASVIKNISKGNTSAIQKGLYLYRVERDFNEAFPYVLEGANQGDLDCQFTLGRMYSEGRGVEKNLKLAVKWYEKAAQRKDPDAQFNLALIYEHGGIGVEIDDVEALKWYQEATNQGVEKAQAKCIELSAKINLKKEVSVSKKITKTEADYNRLHGELYRKASELKQEIFSNYKNYLGDSVQAFQNVDELVKRLDREWEESVNHPDASARLDEDDVKKNIKKYGKNKNHSLLNAGPLKKTDSEVQAVQKSAPLIVEHANRRVDFFFHLMLCVYNKQLPILIAETDRKYQLVSGMKKFNTQAAHSALISNFYGSMDGHEIAIQDQNTKFTYNSTIDLPRIVNQFNCELEGGIKEENQSVWRKTALFIINEASMKGLEPRLGLLEYFNIMLDFFLAKKSSCWNNNVNLEKKLVYFYECIGTFYPLWSNLGLDDYVFSQLRVFLPLDKTNFNSSKIFRTQIYSKRLAEFEKKEVNESNWISFLLGEDTHNKKKREILKQDDFILDLLDRLLYFEKYFDDAMDALTHLVDLRLHDLDVEKYELILVDKLPRFPDFIPRRLPVYIVFDAKAKELKYKAQFQEDCPIIEDTISSQELGDELFDRIIQSKEIDLGKERILLITSRREQTKCKIVVEPNSSRLQVRLEKYFSLFAGTISYKKRLDYLIKNMRAFHDKSYVLIYAIYSCLKMASCNEGEDFAGSFVHPEEGGAKWSYPDPNKDMDYVEYVYDLAKLLVFASNTEDFFLRKIGRSFIDEYIQNNMIGFANDWLIDSSIEEPIRNLVNMMLLCLKALPFTKPTIDYDKICFVSKDFIEELENYLSRFKELEAFELCAAQRMHSFLLSFRINRYITFLNYKEKIGEPSEWFSEQNIEQCGDYGPYRAIDGNCFFASVLIAQGEFNWEKEGEILQNLRVKAINYMLKNPQEFSSYFKTIGELSKYCSAMKISKKYADEPIVMAVQKLIKTKIEFIDLIRDERGEMTFDLNKILNQISHSSGKIFLIRYDRNKYFSLIDCNSKGFVDAKPNSQSQVVDKIEIKETWLSHSVMFQSVPSRNNDEHGRVPGLTTRTPFL